MNNVVLNPCPSDIRAACAKFDADNEVLEKALEELFRQYPRNTEPAHVLLKVTALNALYGTQIPIYSDRVPTILEVTDHIVSLAIDSDLDQGSDDLVARLSRVVVAGKNPRFNYSFSTKYCSWHKPEVYPIFDSRVVAYLWNLRNHNARLNRFRQEDFWNYGDFKKIVIEFRDEFGLGDFTFKELDKFLYSQGGVLFGEKYGMKDKILVANLDPDLDIRGRALLVDVDD